MGNEDIPWMNLLRQLINCEFSERQEKIINEKMSEQWFKPSLWDGAPNIPRLSERILLSWKALLHSVIAKNGYEEKWIERLNKMFEFTSIDHLFVQNLSSSGFSLQSFLVDDQLRDFSDLGLILNNMENEFDMKIDVLGERFKNKLDRLCETFERLIDFMDYCYFFEGNITWKRYFIKRKDLEKQIQEQFENSEDISREGRKNLPSLIRNREMKELQEIFRGITFTFHVANDSKQ